MLFFVTCFEITLNSFPWLKLFSKKAMDGRTQVIFLEGVLIECLYVLTKYYKVTRAEAAGSLVGLLHYKGVVNRDKAVAKNPHP